MKPLKEFSGAVTFFSVAAAFLAIGALMVITSAPQPYSDPLGRMQSIYMAIALVAAAGSSATLAVLLFHIQRNAYVTYLVLVQLREAEELRNQQMMPVEKVASALVARQGL
ncbi:MAG: hypothetical protein FD152_2257 [Xanthobacteraceae bacterium]|nr:MAG: hypothetical protein FD152_2257 [Xanthobacteraceae bacterium]